MEAVILDIHGRQIAIENIEEMIEYSKEAIDWLRNKEGLKFPESQKEWEHILHECEKIQLRNKHSIL